MVGRLADLQLLSDLRDVLAFGQQPVRLAELADDLPVGAIGLSYQVDQPQGVRSNPQERRTLPIPRSTGKLQSAYVT
jgi:hypothetical protein